MFYCFFFFFLFLGGSYWNSICVVLVLVVLFFLLGSVSFLAGFGSCQCCCFFLVNIKLGLIIEINVVTGFWYFCVKFLSFGCGVASIFVFGWKMDLGFIIFVLGLQQYNLFVTCQWYLKLFVICYCLVGDVFSVMEVGI